MQRAHSNMRGLKELYTQMHNNIKNWAVESPPNERGHYIYDIGCALNDAAYHGWSGDKIRTEREIAKKVATAWALLVDALEEAANISTDEKAPRGYWELDKWIAPNENT